LAAGTGGHAIALQERAGQKLTFIAVDESEDNLELAREKAKATVNAGIEFRKEKLHQLAIKDNQFDLLIGDGSLVHSERIPEIFEEMVRVAAPGGTVALALPTFSSFGEFFSIYWEALHNLGLIDHEGDVESLITILPAVSRMEEIAEAAGLENVSSTTSIEEFDFESAEKFLGEPLVADFLMPIWLETLPEDSHKRVLDEIARLVNEESHNVEFALTIKATLVMGEKSASH
jgi:ubiquinone/menaquinone biosynthesis C-methylase UbiE